MPEIDERIDQLQTRLENLVKTQISFQQEISQIRYELNVLRDVLQKRNAIGQTPPAESRKPPVREYVPPPRTAETSSQQINRQSTSDSNRQTNQQSTWQSQQQINQQQTNQSYRQTETSNSGYSADSKSSYYQRNPAQAREKSNVEKFIGENLISKVGIVILVIGVAIGAKYAIDNNLISPLTRIILGYIFGFGLLGFAVKLKAKYHNFSAVLLSGAMAIMYFITYFAFSLYELISQSTAFALMLIFTVFTVFSAISYSRQIIAHLGLVGAYAIPFLLSDNSGKFAVLFTYMAIINVGILAVSLKKYWKPLFYSSFIFTWVIYYGWYLSAYKPAEHFNLAVLFLTVFFLTFYLTFIGYKLISKENVALENVVLVLTNSFIFYGVGYSILETKDGLENYLGMFTVLNAAIHFAFAYTISRMNIFPRDLLYLLTALVLTFATISIPVQLDGNWVTLIWTVEAAILFWIGRTKQIPLYEYYSYPLMLFATASLLLDWLTVEQTRSIEQIAVQQFSVFDGNFVTSLLFAAIFGFIFYTNKNEAYESAIDEVFRKPFGYLIAALSLGVLYNTFRLAIGNYFHLEMVKTGVPRPVSRFGQTELQTDNNLKYFNIIWQINYTMFFLSLLSLVNLTKFKSVALAFCNLVLNVFALMIFVTVGLFLLGELRESFLLQTSAELFRRGSFHIYIRYVSYVFAAGLLAACYAYFKQKFLFENVSQNAPGLAFDFIFFVALLFVLSSELVNWMDIFGYKDSYKLGLSILWGTYALFLIILGIYRRKKFLRVGAILLFAVTLAKLFFYDIAELNTISKTVVFVSLGILMLIVSFLYNKYKTLIFEATES